MDDVRRVVREEYGKIGSQDSGCYAPFEGRSTSCCGSKGPEAQARQLGYSKDELENLPDGANMGLGCGNPQAIASLKPGETVLDLGSGGGIDCFLAAKQVGDSGQVIGVDMTPEMVSRARDNAEKSGVKNVEFRLGEIEHLPVADGSVDVILSNCVVNLSPDKGAVYREAFRVLKPKGRLAIADIVTTSPLPAEIRENLGLHASCIGGAATISALKGLLADAGFTDIRIDPVEGSRSPIRDWATEGRGELQSATIRAVRP